MTDKDWKLIFRPTDDKMIIICIVFVLLIAIFLFIEWSINKLILCVVALLLILAIFVVLIELKKTYLEIQETGIMVWLFQIPSFKTIEKYIQYSDIENITILNSMSSNYGNQIQLKLRDQRKKIVIPWLTDKAITEIKDIFIKKSLLVSVHTQVNVLTKKRETEDFNKNP